MAEVKLNIRKMLTVRGTTQHLCNFSWNLLFTGFSFALGADNVKRNVFERRIEIKNILRIVFGFFIVTPFALFTHLISVFTGKQKAVAILGPTVTIFAKSIQQFFPPKIIKASEFDLFKSKLKDKHKIWSILFDYPIEYPDENTAKLVIQNCPFAKSMTKLKVSELGYYMCQGDWEVAKENSEKWEFERTCTIGTDGTICDFTYKRIRKEN